VGARGSLFYVKHEDHGLSLCQAAKDFISACTREVFYGCMHSYTIARLDSLM
jgi:hypothetical protein